MKKLPFYDLFNRNIEADLNGYVRTHTEDDDYIVWNDYLVPNHFGDAAAEYHAIRNSCAIFDVTPIRKFSIRGGDAGQFLDRLVTRPVSHSPSMRGIYVALCDEKGILKDDAILYKFADDDYLMMPSEIDHTAHFESVRRTLGLDDVTIEDCKDSMAGCHSKAPFPRPCSIVGEWKASNI